MANINFKGLQVDASLAALLPRMESVNEHRESLQQLQGVWDSLALLGQMSGVATDIDTTRHDFHQLTQAMVQSLARRSLAHSAQAMGAKAQVAIDVLVRNLFERTADVGFLATDPVLVEHAQRARAGQAADDDAGLLRQHQALQARFRAYVAKYSVYDDIVVLAPDGRVLVRLDDSVDVARVSDPLIEQALRPGTPFVETFGHSPILGGRRGLLYSAAIRAPEGGVALGVLCLSFRFDNEMRGIHSHLAAAHERSVAVLLDAAGQVLASSDPWQLPCGAVLAARADLDHQTLYFAGRDYLATTRRTVGYQGYGGPTGWQACVLSPLEFAFRTPLEQGGAEADIDMRRLAGAIHNTALFDDELRAIPLQAQRIQRDLERSVWNGRVANREQGASGAAGPGITGSASFAGALLREVASTGERIKGVFERAIGSLHASAMMSVLDDMGFRASLVVDIQDRNLYERANDCRWWAMNPVLREALAVCSAEGSGRGEGPANAERATQVLKHIHSLYTVYALLLVFDREGRVVAVSQPGAREWVGRTLDAGWVRDTLALRDSQAFAVSRFEPSPLHGGQHTLIYGAAVFAPDSAQQVCGGIGIVFDTAPQFSAMLRDCLPAGEQAIGLLVERSGQVLASSDEARFPVGSRAPLAALVAALGRSQAHQAVVELDGMFYAAGLCQSAGYREYRSGHAPDAQDVAGVVLMPLCPADADAAHAHRAPPAVPARMIRVPQADRLEVASFLTGGQWLGLPAAEVVEALEAPRLTAVPNAPAFFVGLLSRSGQASVPVVDLAMLRGMPRPAASATASRLVLVCRHDSGASVGLLVDELAPVFELDQRDLQPMPAVAGGHGDGERLLCTGGGGVGQAGHDMLIMLVLGQVLAQLGFRRGAPGLQSPQGAPSVMAPADLPSEVPSGLPRATALSRSTDLAQAASC